MFDVKDTFHSCNGLFIKETYIFTFFALGCTLTNEMDYIGGWDLLLSNMFTACFRR